MTTQLGPEVSSHPPQPPQQGSNVVAIMWWSLELRWWAWRNTPASDSKSQQVRMFIIYHQGEPGRALQHSLGLQKGLIGIVHAFAHDDAQGLQNNVVIAHELMHTVGATDKYSPDSNLPAFPDGYANPEQVPLYPQKSAEIMAGRIAESSQDSRMAESLRQVVVGTKTAHEVNWITNP